jgi:membrane-bound metal-dependent hydrolase YbcI (DUF457 family)
MPSPIGHALGGIAAGALIAPHPGWRLLTVCALAGALPDVDFLLPLRHRGASHSLGIAAMVFVVIVIALRMRPETVARWRIAAAVSAAYATHTLLDWLGADTSTPRGLMALWPASSAYYISGLDIFNSADRRYWMPGFWARNAVTLLREAAILGPLTAICVSRGRRDRSCRQPGAPPPPA